MVFRIRKRHVVKTCVCGRARSTWQWGNGVGGRRRERERSCLRCCFAHPRRDGWDKKASTLHKMHRTPYTPHRLPPTLLVWFQAASCALFWRRQPSSISSINWASVSTGSSSFHKHQNLIPSSVKRPTPTTYSLSPLFLALSSILFLTILKGKQKQKPAIVKWTSSAAHRQKRELTRSYSSRVEWISRRMAAHGQSSPAPVTVLPDRQDGSPFFW